MNPILVQQMATYRMDQLDREAAAGRLVALARSAAAGNSSAFPERPDRSAGRLRLVLRLVLRGAAA